MIAAAQSTVRSLTIGASPHHRMRLPRVDTELRAFLVSSVPSSIIMRHLTSRPVLMAPRFRSESRSLSILSSRSRLPTPALLSSRSRFMARSSVSFLSVFPLRSRSPTPALLIVSVTLHRTVVAILIVARGLGRSTGFPLLPFVCMSCLGDAPDAPDAESRSAAVPYVNVRQQSRSDQTNILECRLKHLFLSAA